MSSYLDNVDSSFNYNSNITDMNTHEIPRKWYYILEAVLVGLSCSVGLVANTAVIRGSLKAKRFIKQNTFLFFGLSLSDYFTCMIRGPCLIYILFHTEDSPDVVCELWVISTIFLIIAIFTNMVVAVERRMIMCNYQRYQSLFTARRVLVASVLTWFILAGAFMAVYKGAAFRATFHLSERSCQLNTSMFQMNKMTATIVRVCGIVFIGLCPILVQAVSYVSILIKIYKAELLKLDRLDEKITYTRITGIAFARVLLTSTCLFPVLICFAICPMFPEIYYTNVRFLDNLTILQSTLSPFISMYDSDFRDIFVYRAWRCWPFKRSIGSKKGSKRSNGITSAEMKTFGLS